MREYFFPPLLLPLFILLILPLLMLIFFFTTPTVFQIVFGLDYFNALLIFTLIVFGSFVNIPIYEKEGKVVVKEYSFFGFIYAIKERQKIVVAVNLGGCVLPSILALKLLFEVPILPWLISFLISTIVIYNFAKPIAGVGIAVPMFVPPITSAISSYIALSLFNLPIVLLPKIAFSSGIFSALFGADLMHLKDLEKIGSGVVSIGGAGTFDGIFLTGIFAVVFSLFLI